MWQKSVKNGIDVFVTICSVICGAIELILIWPSTIRIPMNPYHSMVNAVKSGLTISLLGVGLFVFVGCQTTGSSEFTRKTESLGINSQFKPFYARNNYGVIPYSLMYDEDGEMRDTITAISSMPPFEYNLYQMVQDVASEHISINKEEDPASDTSIIFYTDINTKIVPLSADDKQLLNIYEDWHIISQAFLFYSPDQEGGLIPVGRIDYHFNTFDSNISSDLRKLRRVYSRALSYFGKSLDSKQIISFDQGILQEDVVSESMSKERLRVHRIQLGENLVRIAKMYGVGLQSLIDLNPDVNPRNLQVGQEVLVPLN